MNNGECINNVFKKGLVKSLYLKRIQSDGGSKLLCLELQRGQVRKVKKK